MPEMSTNEIYHSLSILKVTSIHKLELGKLIYTSFYMEKYPKLRMAIQNLGWSHNFNTRKINALRLPRAPLNVDRNSVIFSAISFWNSLPIAIRGSRSLRAFMRALSSYLLISQTCAAT